MTLDEYNDLPIDEQEKFINGGGNITLPTQINGVSAIDDAPLIKDTPISQLAIESPNITQEFVTPLSVIGESKLTGSLDVVPPVLRTSKVKEVSNESSPLVSTSIKREGFDITDPVELLYLVDEDIQSGDVRLHKWQVQFMLDFAKGGQTDETPFQSVVRACNGSGKDMYLIAACAVWLCMKFRLTACVITSSSGAQLDRQTCRYIKYLCERLNRKFGLELWILNYRNYKLTFGDGETSEMFCYATDEPGKAEGYHPSRYNAKMAIFASEDKTIPDEINTAMSKCTGYTHRCHVSTPGLPFGHFHDYCARSIPRDAVKSVLDVQAIDWIQYHVTYKDCPHISEAYRQQCIMDLPGGENGAAYKSQFLAEFGTTDEMVVIPYTHIWKAKNKDVSHWIQEEHNKAGLDLSDGGDETVLVVRNGNRLLKVIPFKFDNTEDTIEFLNEKFRENNLTHPDSYIFSDCGGIGKPMLDRMRRQGWNNIRYCDNRKKTNRPKTYRNWGAQSWFDFGKLLQQDEIILVNDVKLIRQLSTRYYKILDGAIHQLLSKLEMRSRGYPSPDRADACVLAFSDYKSTFVEDTDKEKEKPFEVPEVKKVASDFVLKSWAAGNRGDYDLSKWNVNNGQKDFDDLTDEVADYNRKLVNK